MKLDELREDVEYAVHKHYVAGNVWGDRPAHAVLLGIALHQDHSHRHYRLARVKLLADATWGGIDGNKAGDVLELRPTHVWRLWSDQARLDEARNANDHAAQSNLNAVRKALGQLGLHAERYIHPQPEAEETEVTVSAYELTKLADAVVALETLVYNWWQSGHPAAHNALRLWAETHDFSNVTGEAPRQL